MLSFYGKENSFKTHLKPGPKFQSCVLRLTWSLHGSGNTGEASSLPFREDAPAPCLIGQEEQVGGKRSAGEKTRLLHAVAVHPPPAAPMGSPGSSSHPHADLIPNVLPELPCFLKIKTGILSRNLANSERCLNLSSELGPALCPGS